MNMYINPKAENVVIRQYYPQITEAYKTAFAGPPWFEASICVDSNRRCGSNFSPLKVGGYCETCQQCTDEPAYNNLELVERFESIACSRESRWYLELEEGELTLAALAWVADVKQIASEKYQDTPGMEEWMTRELGSEPVIWLDEVFADRSVKPSGNLSNFRSMCSSFGDLLQNGTIAYRTITGQMKTVAQKLAPAALLKTANQEVPDRRDFIVIRDL